MEKKSALKLTTKQHTGYGIMSFILGVLSIVCFGWAVMVSALNDHGAQGVAIKIGIIEIIAILMSMVGIPFGIMGELTKETFKLYAHLGVVLNVLVIIFHILVLVHGY